MVRLIARWPFYTSFAKQTKPLHTEFSNKKRTGSLMGALWFDTMGWDQAFIMAFFLLQVVIGLAEEKSLSLLVRHWRIWSFSQWRKLTKVLTDLGVIMKGEQSRYLTIIHTWSKLMQHRVYSFNKSLTQKKPNAKQIRIVTIQLLNHLDMEGGGFVALSSGQKKKAAWQG